jgi:HK97 family phage prohead protease
MTIELKYLERPFEIKAVQEDGVFEGFGSVFGNVDAYKEVVAPGAFAESLAGWKAAGRLPPVLWQHRSGEPIGPYLEMEEQFIGLHVKGQLLVNDVQRAKEARALMKAKAVNGLSIGFVTREDSYDRVTGIRTLKKVDLWEVSVVTFPANPAAQISSVKGLIDAIESLSEAERFLEERGLTKSQSTGLIARIKSLSGRGEPGPDPAGGRGEPDELAELKRAMEACVSAISA